MARGRTLVVLCFSLVGCAGKAAHDAGQTPVQLLRERELASCQYERLATVVEERTTSVINPEKEMQRALGLKARWLKADAIIEMKVVTLVPFMTNGPSSGSTGSRRAGGVRATAEAIRFISETCPRPRDG
ncbi:MAG: hypothetical protein ACRENP_11430 [Longimicrobiales bacterium]